MGNSRVNHGRTKNVSSHEKIVAIEKILEKYEIWSGEQIAQSDSFSENAVEMMCEIAEVVGWAKCPYDEDE
jgi:hypothetical protein